MNSIKCPHCGLVNFQSQESCKRCKGNLAARPNRADSATSKLQESTALQTPKALGAFKFKSTMSVMAIVTLVIGAVLTVIGFIFGLFLRSSMKDGEAPLILILVGIVPLLCCVGLLTKLTGKKVEVYQNGFIYKDKKNEFTIFWHEIQHCRESIEWILVDGIPIGRGKEIKVTTYHGEELTLSQEIGGLNSIIKTLRENLDHHPASNAAWR